MKFAKIFEVDDTQILFMLTFRERDGEEVLEHHMITHTSEGYEVRLVLGIDREALEAFEAIDQKIAEELRVELITKAFGFNETIQ